FEGASPREYFNSAVVTLPVSTSYLPLILEAAQEILQRLYRPGYQYRNIMVNLLNLENDTDEQLELFDREPQEFRARNKAVMAAMDTVNSKYGFGTLTTGTRYQMGASVTRLHSQQSHLDSPGNWIMQRSLLSPEYTTDFAGMACVG
ncbi:MAG: DUF4113 domain-containing protein, partial [Treponemataceae bacterium]|nr:DUF4113 domain-containing protein [Treponemataceae bacterium]